MCRSVKLRLFLVGLFWGLALIPVFASDGQEVPAFSTFLELLSGPLVSAAVAILLSVIVEYIPQYGSLSGKMKRLVFFGLCIVVPVLAATLRGALGYAPWNFDPLFWQAIWAGFSAAGVGTLAHTRKL